MAMKIKMADKRKKTVKKLKPKVKKRSKNIKKIKINKVEAQRQDAEIQEIQKEQRLEAQIQEILKEQRLEEDEKIKKRRKNDIKNK